MSLKDLNHVAGIVTSERYMKHFHSGSNRYVYHPSYYEDVLVLSIQGCTDEFGFMEKDKSYSDLTKIHFGDNETVADVYYDKSGQRIEENVTLHTFDLKIDDVRYIKIEEIQKSEMTGSLIFSLVAIVLSWLTYVGAKRIKLKGHV